MSTKSAPWSKWPSRWLKTLPNADIDGPSGGVLEFENGSLAPTGKAGVEGSKPPSGAVLRFEDFVEQPLRSPSRQEAAKGRGRKTGAAGRGGSGNDGSNAPGA